MVRRPPSSRRTGTPFPYTTLVRPHEAALKHGPRVDVNPLEGLHTNVLGTRNVADACRRAAVAAMVLVSTDKAVNPPNVMGASKRLAESYCQALDLLRQTSGSGTRYKIGRAHV